MDWKEYNLVTFGCSHTFGQGLSDCIGADVRSAGPVPSKQAWPSILKTLVGFKSLHNDSWPGLSNKIITKKIIDYEYKKNTVVIILWSNFNRHTIFNNKGESKLHMFPAMIKKEMPLAFWKQHYREKDELTNLVKTYYENYYEEYDVTFDQIVRINFVHSFLNDKGIRNIHLVMEHELTNEYFKKFNLSGINIKKFNWKKHYWIDDALDKPRPHPGPESHKLFAYNINKWFFKK